MAKGEWETLSPPERLRVYVYKDGTETIECRNVARVKVSASSDNHYVDAESVRKCIDGRPVASAIKGIIPPGWQAILLDVDAWTF